MGPHRRLEIGKPGDIAATRKRRSGSDPLPLQRSDLKHVFDIKEDCNGKEAIQA